MTYEEYIAGQERQKRAHLIREELAQVTETLQAIRGGDIIVKVDVGTKEFIMPYAVERLFTNALQMRADELEKEFSDL